MYYKNVPKYLLIFYTMDYDYHGDFRPTIRSSIPFFTKKEAEEYLNIFVSNTGGNDSHILTAIIPASEE